jgi:hypothetical protein
MVESDRIGLLVESSGAKNSEVKELQASKNFTVKELHGLRTPRSKNAVFENRLGVRSTVL